MPRLVKQIISYVATAFIYVAFFNWRVSILLIAIIGLHEAGHIYTAKFFGVKTGGSYMLPFMGGVSTFKSLPTTYYHDAMISLAGPFAGLIISWVLLGLYGITYSVFWLAFCIINSIMNLFNLLPLAFLDGGRIANGLVNSINNKYNYPFTIVSNVALCLLVLKLNPFLTPLVLMFGIAAIMVARSNHLLIKQGLPPKLSSEKMSKEEFWLIVMRYVALCIVLSGTLFISMVYFPANDSLVSHLLR